MEFMRLGEAAAYIGRSEAQVRRYVDKGSIPIHHRETGKIYVARQDVEKFAREHRIRTVESEVPQGTNFTEKITVWQMLEQLKREIQPGATITYEDLTIKREVGQRVALV